MAEKLSVINREDLDSTPLGVLLDTAQSLMTSIDIWPEAMDVFDLLAQFTKSADRTAELELDTTMLQFVVYILLRTPEGNYLTYRRKGAETRLQGLKSIGFGGHVGAWKRQECSLRNHVEAAAVRELLEEIPGVTQEMCDKLSHIGFLFDQSNPVGRVHLGCLFEIQLNENDVSVLAGNAELSEECGRMEFEKFDLQKTSEYETWSVLARDVSVNRNRLLETLSNPVKLTLMRSQGSRGLFTVPERDHSLMVASLLQEATWSLISRAWPGLDELFMQSRPDFPDKMGDTVGAIHLLYSKAGTPTPGYTFSQACKDSGWFCLPMETRAVAMAHLALAMLSRSWTMLHQYILGGNNAIGDFKETDRAAGKFLERCFLSEDHSAIAAVIACAKDAGFERGRLISMVNAAYGHTEGPGAPVS